MSLPAALRGLARLGLVAVVLDVPSCGSGSESTGVVAWRRACRRVSHYKQVPCLEKLVTLAEREPSVADDMARCIIELTEDGREPEGSDERLLACLSPYARSVVQAFLAEEEAARGPSSSLAEAYMALSERSTTEGESQDSSTGESSP